MIRRPHTLLAVAIFAAGTLSTAAAAGPDIRVERSDAKGRLRVLIDGQEAFVYRYGPKVDLVHYYPVRSPSGRSMTVQHPERFPHHRSFWFADEVKLGDGRKVNFYNAYYTKAKDNDARTLYRDHIRHVRFRTIETRSGTDHARARIVSDLLWEMDHDKAVLDEERRLRVIALGDGEYLMDITFTVTAAYGPVTFTSDWVHYAWPYIRMNERFNVNSGNGKIVNSAGGVNKAGTNGKEAKWVDYSATVEGTTDGLAIFSHPDNPQPHRWLTRDYGCFGPRRVRKHSGERFTLEKGDSLTRRVGVLVHQGDVKGGRVAERYKAYAAGELGGS